MDTLTRLLCILHALAACPAGASAGMVSKKVSAYGCHLTKAQCALTLSQLGQGGYVRIEKRDYRTNIKATYYHLNESTVSTLASICTEYMQNEKQRPLDV